MIAALVADEDRDYGELEIDDAIVSLPLFGRYFKSDFFELD